MQLCIVEQTSYFCMNKVYWSYSEFLVFSEFSAWSPARGPQESRGHRGHIDRVHWYHTPSVRCQQGWKASTFGNGKVNHLDIYLISFQFLSSHTTNLYFDIFRLLPVKENFLSRQIFKVILSFSLEYAKLKLDYGLRMVAWACAY